MLKRWFPTESVDPRIWKILHYMGRDYHGLLTSFQLIKTANSSFSMNVRQRTDIMGALLSFCMINAAAHIFENQISPRKTIVQRLKSLPDLDQQGMVMAHITRAIKVNKSGRTYCTTKANLFLWMQRKM